MKTTKKSVVAKPKKLSVSLRENNSRYDLDFFGWTRVQANFLRKHQFSNLDIKNLVEEIESLGNSQLSALESYLTVLLLHLLKIKYQETMRTRSWDLSIKNSRYHIARLIEKNPGLKNKILETLKDAYFSARLGAIDETGLEENIFPEKCEWSFDEIMSMNGERASKHAKPKSKSRRKTKK